MGKDQQDEASSSQNAEWHWQWSVHDRGTADSGLALSPIRVVSQTDCNGKERVRRGSHLSRASRVPGTGHAWQGFNDPSSIHQAIFLVHP